MPAAARSSTTSRLPARSRRARWTCWTSASRRQSGDTANVVFAVESGTLREPERRAAIERTVEEIRAQPHVTSAPSPFAEDSGQLSEDGRIAYVPVQYDDTAAALGKEPGERLEQASEIGDRAGLEVSRNGAIVDQAEQTTAPVGELIGVAVAMIVLTLVFRSVAAMALTLISALIALAGGLLLLQFASAFADFPSFAPTLGVMLGLGAGHRLRAADRRALPRAAGERRQRRATPRASRTPPPAHRWWRPGAIVVVAITGLLATGIPFVGQMGIGSAIIIAMVAVGAVTVLPTLMGAFARRLRPKRPEHVEPSQRFARWAGVDHAPAARGRRRRACSCSSCSPCRSPRCASASPTTATTAPARPRASPTTGSPRASAPASTARSSSPPRLPPTAPARPP